jgi:hypothetical protein
MASSSDANVFTWWVAPSLAEMVDEIIAGFEHAVDRAKQSHVRGGVTAGPCLVRYFEFSRGAAGPAEESRRPAASFRRARRGTPRRAGLSFLLLVRLVVTDGATCRGAENAMVAGKMPRHSTHDGALDAAFGLGWRRYSDEYHRNCGVFEDLFHHLLPVESMKTTFNTRLVRIVPPDWIRQSVSRTQRTASATANPITEAVQRSTIEFVAAKTAKQVDLQALHPVRERRRGLLATPRTPDDD